MNNLDVAKASVKDQLVIFKRKHNWIMCWLYLGTFGSFIGYSAAFPKLIKLTFSEIDPLQYAFLGPFLGAISRPIGGWISDKLGGAKVTFINYIAMIIAVIGVIYFLKIHSFSGFFIMFLILFVTTGIGNASVFKMIPVIFLEERLKAVKGLGTEAEAQARRDAAKEASASLGFVSAIGAYGGFIIPIAFGHSIKAGSPQTALIEFCAFYFSCLALTWWYYYRKNAEAPA